MPTERQHQEAAAEDLQRSRESLPVPKPGTPIAVIRGDALAPAGDPYPVPGSLGHVVDTVEAPPGYAAVSFLPPLRLLQGGALNIPSVLPIPLDCLKALKEG